MNKENRQNEERMEDFESFFEVSLQQYRPGEVVRGTIVDIRDDKGLVNFGYKTEGVVSMSELEGAKVGDEVELSIVKMNNDGVILSKKAINAKGDFSAIKEKESSGIPVEVKITEFVSNDKTKGYRGRVGEIEAFIPENLIDINLKEIDPAKFINKVSVLPPDKKQILKDSTAYVGGIR